MKPQKENKEISAYNDSRLLESVFIKDTKLQYIFKKTEKIVTAIYLVTNFLVPEEPLKWSLRKSGSDLLKTLMAFSQSSLSDIDKASRDLNVKILELNSLFGLAYHSGFVSQMNYEILDHEINKLISVINEYNQNMVGSQKSLFDQDYFHVPKNEDAGGSYKGQNYRNEFLHNSVFYNNDSSQLKDDRGFDNDVRDEKRMPQNNVFQPNYGDNSNKGQKFQPENQLKTGIKKTGRLKNKKTNEERRAKILEEVKRHEKVSVKDIARVIIDCSEKTLQRELLALVEEGILHKEGERRWSRYSLKK